MANPIWTGVSSTVYTLVANWNPATAPAASGNVFFNDQAVGPVAGSDQSGTALATFHVNMNCTFNIGDNGTPLKINSPLVYVGEPSMSGISGAGAGRINIDLGTTATTAYVYNSSSSSTDTGKEPVRIKGVNAANEITVEGGLVGFATDNIADVATIGTINVCGGTAHIASGVTLTTLNISSGEADLYTAATTINISAGTLNTRGDFAIGTLTVYGGTVNLAHRKVAAGDEITTLNLYNATVDFSDNPDPVVINSLSYSGNCRIIRNAANRGHVTITGYGTQAGVLTLDAA